MFILSVIDELVVVMVLQKEVRYFATIHYDCRDIYRSSKYKNVNVIYISSLLRSPSITDDDDFLINVEDTTWRGRIHVPKKLKVRRGCTVPSPLT